jgi:hypothetical protein
MALGAVGISFLRITFTLKGPAFTGDCCWSFLPPWTRPSTRCFYSLGHKRSSSIPHTRVNLHLPAIQKLS